MILISRIKLIVTSKKVNLLEIFTRLTAEIITTTDLTMMEYLSCQYDLRLMIVNKSQKTI
jgi:hypothetical protein